MRLRPGTERDLVERTQHYLDQAGPDVASRFLDAAVQMVNAIRRLPQRRITAPTRRLHEDEHRSFDWAAPDDDVFVLITDLVRSVGSYLYGRRMYDTMAVWETNPPGRRSQN